MRKEQIPLLLQTCNSSHLWLCALLTDTDSDGSARGALHAITNPCPLHISELSQHTEVPSLPFDSCSPSLQEDPLLFTHLSNPHSVRINPAKSPSMAFSLCHPSWGCKSTRTLCPCRRSCGGTGHLTPAFEEQARFYLGDARAHEH